ncbi:MAG: hypothetical protein E7812_14390 [Phenylobacterium sp.]|nr:MAG: hypothetical protein E7812_14390 [Phenylobacterium sp.]
MRNPWRAIGLALALTIATGVAAAPTRPLFVAFYVPWEPPALASLKAHVQAMDVFAPMWASVVSTKGDLRWETDPEAHAVLAAAARRPKVMPVVSNAHDDVWDVAAAEAVITDPVAGEALAKALVTQAQADKLAGYVMDFENLSPRGQAGYPAFVGRLRARLKAAGLEVWVTSVMSSTDDFTKSADAVVLMAYDQCWATSTPGPIASDGWLRDSLQAKLGSGDPRRYVVALASYGYDWPQGRTATVVAAPAAVQLAARMKAAVAPLPNPHFSYPAAGARHDVWFLDGAAFARQRALVERRGARGVALWRMGLEDPALWTAKAAAPQATAAASPDCQPLPHP